MTDYLKKKNTKLPGKDQAKLNKRKKFYIKLERYYNRFGKDEEPIIFLTMNKKLSFPEFDSLSIVLNKADELVDLDPKIDMEKALTLEIVYFEEAQYILESSNAKLLKICRRETEFNNEGDKRKGLTLSKDEYNYQKAFNWAIRVDKNKKLDASLKKEIEEPKYYDLTPPKAIIQEPVHYKSQKPPRRRKR